jgi:RNA 2',3'-cyclic 3'-phosphodiesterase
MKPSGAMRLFVAINPTPEARRSWTDALEPLRRLDWPVRWVAADALHLTLAFLGNVGDERVDEIAAALAEVAARTQPFTMHVRGLGAFPDVRRPRLLWLGIEPDPPLLALQREVADRLQRLGFEPDVRTFSPHITVARARGAAARIGGVEHAIDSFRFDDAVPVDGIDLMKSSLAQDGARYERVRRAGLGMP